LRELKKVDRVSGSGILPDVQNDTNYNPEGYGLYGGEVDPSLIDQFIEPAKKGAKEVGDKIYDYIDPSGSYKDVLDNAIEHIDQPAYLATLAYDTISDAIKGKTPYNSTQATKNEYNSIMKARQNIQLPEEDRRMRYDAIKQGMEQWAKTVPVFKSLVPKSFESYDAMQHRMAARTPRTREQLLSDRKARRGDGITTYGGSCMECGCDCHSGGRLMAPAEVFEKKKNLDLIKRM
jgi:hypothetical protein